MNTRFLFPNSFKMIGWIILIPSAILGLLWFIGAINIPPINVQVLSLDSLFNNKGLFIKNDIVDEILGALITIGGTMAAFSKSKNEDEYISKIRLESLLWATYINYGLLFLSILYIYDIAFFQVLVFNMFTLLVIFLVRFNFILLKNSNQAIDEE